MWLHNRLVVATSQDEENGQLSLSPFLLPTPQFHIHHSQFRFTLNPRVPRFTFHLSRPLPLTSPAALERLRFHISLKLRTQNSELPCQSPLSPYPFIPLPLAHAFHVSRFTFHVPLPLAPLPLLSRYPFIPLPPTLSLQPSEKTVVALLYPFGAHDNLRQRSHSTL